MNIDSSSYPSENFPSRVFDGSFSYKKIEKTCITFRLEILDTSYTVAFSPSRGSVNVLARIRKDIWKKSELQNIVDTLNFLKIPIVSSDKLLEIEYSEAIEKELQRQCDVWNSKLPTISTTKPVENLP